MSESEIPGGWSEEAPVTLEVIQICLQLRKSILNRIENNSEVFIPVNFIYQLVVGGNYVVKVYVGEEDEDVCAHVKIFQDLPCKGGKLTVEGIQFPKTFADPLVPF